MPGILASQLNPFPGLWQPSDSPRLLLVLLCVRCIDPKLTPLQSSQSVDLPEPDICKCLFSATGPFPPGVAGPEECLPVHLNTRLSCPSLAAYTLPAGVKAPLFPPGMRLLNPCVMCLAQPCVCSIDEPGVTLTLRRTQPVLFHTSSTQDTIAAAHCRGAGGRERESMGMAAGQ